MQVSEMSFNCARIIISSGQIPCAWWKSILDVNQMSKTLITHLADFERLA